MREHISEYIESAFIDVLTNYAFIFADRVEPEELQGSDEEEYLQVSIEVMADAVCQILVAMPYSLANTITVNVIGLEGEGVVIDKARAEDSTKEMINVLCGQLQTLLGYEPNVFHIALPKAAAINKEEWDSLIASPDTLHFTAEDEPLLFVFKYEGGKQ